MPQKDLRVLVLGETTPQLRYLSRYASVVFIPVEISSHPVITVAKLVGELGARMISFEPDVLLVYPGYPLGVLSAIVAKFFRKPHVAFFYGNDALNRHTRIGKIMVRFILRLSDGIMCDCRSIVSPIRRMGGRNVVAIPMGLDASGMSIAPRSKQRSTIVCAVNFALAYWKGIDLLIRAVDRIPQASLILIGEGSQRKMMMRFAEKLGITDRVTFTGYVPRVELWSILKQASLFVLPTRASFIEGTNRAVLEAMYCNLPVVVTRTGGLPEIVANEANGFVVQPEKLNELVAAIRFLLDNPRLREEIGQRNRKKAEGYLAKLLNAKRYEYLTALKRR